MIYTHIAGTDTQDGERIALPLMHASVRLDLSVWREEIHKKINLNGQCAAEQDRCDTRPVSGILQALGIQAEVQISTEEKDAHRKMHEKEIARLERLLDAEAVVTVGDTLHPLKDIEFIGMDRLQQMIIEAAQKPAAVEIPEVE